MMRGFLSKIPIALQVNKINQAIFFRVHHSRLDSMFLVKVWEELGSSKINVALESIDERKDFLLFCLSALFAFRVPNTRGVFSHNCSYVLHRSSVLI